MPADIGHGEPVDIRRVRPAWPIYFFHPEGSLGDPTEHGGGVNGAQFDSDQASLWWYLYASTRDEQATGSTKAVRSVDVVAYAASVCLSEREGCSTLC